MTIERGITAAEQLAEAEKRNDDLYREMWERDEKARAKMAEALNGESEAVLLLPTFYRLADWWDAVYDAIVRLKAQKHT